MSKIIKPFKRGSQTYTEGPFTQPQDMSERAYLDLYQAGNLADLTPEDLLEDYTQEEFEAVLALIKTLKKGCWNCRRA